MIALLDHQNKEIAKDIRALFQVSYAVEAMILKADYFPPLHRSLEAFIETGNKFYGYWEAKSLAAAIELDFGEHSVHIQSLVVDPGFFRQGKASQLIQYVKEEFAEKEMSVETGVDNKPAVQLYLKHDFKEVKQWDTDHGIRKIRFELSKITAE